MFSILASKKEPSIAEVPMATARGRIEPDRAATRASALPAPIDLGRNPSGRKACRVAAAAIPGITGLRISPRGIEATLVNLSSTGLLAACGERLRTGAKVVVNVEGTFTPAQIAGSVVRNYVASVSADGMLQYQVAIAFERPIALDVESEVRMPMPPPAVEPAAVRVVQNRW